MEALLPLLAGIVTRYGIAPANVVGHSDVAPARKEDPGELFDWARLARHGLAIARPTRDLIDPHWTDGGFLLALERWGYDVRDGQQAVIAFQRRFRPELLDGLIDGECRAILLQLLLDRERGASLYRRGQRVGRPPLAQAGGGKSGLHGTTVPVNGRRGRPQGKCHRKQVHRRFRCGTGRKGAVRAHRASGNGGGTANPTGSKTE